MSLLSFTKLKPLMSACILFVCISIYDTKNPPSIKCQIYLISFCEHNTNICQFTNMFLFTVKIQLKCDFSNCGQWLSEHLHWRQLLCSSRTGSIRADSRLAPSQWDTSLQSNAISHWLGANLESALSILIGRSSKTTDNYFCKMWFACETHRLNGSLVEQVLSVLVLSYVSAG